MNKFNQKTQLFEKAAPAGSTTEKVEQLTKHVGMQGLVIDAILETVTFPEKEAEEGVQRMIIHNGNKKMVWIEPAGIFQSIKPVAPVTPINPETDGN